MQNSPTANMWTTRDVIDQIGHFDGRLLSGGDRDFGERVFSAGMCQHYADNVIVRHPARYSVMDLAAMCRRIVGGDCDRLVLRGASRLRVLQGLVSYTGTFLKQLAHACQTDRLRGLCERLQVMGISLFVWGIRIMEAVRLVCGGCSRRA
jgi:hypothetical protein